MSFKLPTFFLFLMFSFTVTVKSQDIVNHPRLIFLKGEEVLLNTALENDSIKLKFHQKILIESNRILERKPVERIKVGMRLLATSREALLRIFYLSYSWRMTGEQRYVERAKQELEAVAAFEDWNPSHFLDVAEMTIALSIGYDWLYDQLSPGERANISNAILEKGLKPSMDTANNWWLKADHNWNQVCNAGMVMGALAIYEGHKVYSQKIIDRSRESIKLPMKDYEPDGSYPEGYMYWGYGTTFNVLLIDALEKAFSKDFNLSQNSGFLSTASYMQSMTGPSGWSFNFSDADLGGVLQPAMFWFAQKLKNPSLLWVEKQHLQTYKLEDRADMRLLPLALIWSKDIQMSEINVQTSRLWTGGGKTPVALMRSSWTNPKSIYVGFKGGSPSTNHSHMDIGSFVMEADGVRWALDFGKQDYESLESKKINIWKFNQESDRWKVFRYHNLSHNTLTVNNGLQNVKGFAPIISSSAAPNFTNAIVDLSSLYPDLKTAKRGLAIVNEQMVAVKDEFTATDKPTVVRWTMLTAAKVEIFDKRKIKLTQEGKELFLLVEGNGEISLKTWSTKSLNSFDADNSGTTFVGYEINLKAGETASNTVYLMPSSIKLNPKLKLPSLENWNK